MLYVKDIMTRRVKTTKLTDNVRKAATAMAESGIGALIVVDRGTPVGMITEGDVSRAVSKNLDSKKTTVKSIMSKPLISITPELRVEEAAQVMANNNVKKLPVIEGGKLLGIVTQTDIVASSFDLVTALKEMVRARYRPPDFQP